MNRFAFAFAIFLVVLGICFVASPPNKKRVLKAKKPPIIVAVKTKPKVRKKPKKTPLEKKRKQLKKKAKTKPKHPKKKAKTKPKQLKKQGKTKPKQLKKKQAKTKPKKLKNEAKDKVKQAKQKQAKPKPAAKKVVQTKPKQAKKKQVNKSPKQAKRKPTQVKATRKRATRQLRLRGRQVWKKFKSQLPVMEIGLDGEDFMAHVERSGGEQMLLCELPGNAFYQQSGNQWRRVSSFTPRMDWGWPVPTDLDVSRAPRENCVSVAILPRRYSESLRHAILGQLSVLTGDVRKVRNVELNYAVKKQSLEVEFVRMTTSEGQTIEIGSTLVL